MAAPYHRLSSGIVTAHRLLAAPPGEARDIALDAKVNYVVVCGPRPPDGLLEPARSRSLWARLQAGTAPDWLEPVGSRSGIRGVSRGPALKPSASPCRAKGLSYMSQDVAGGCVECKFGGRRSRAGEPRKVHPGAARARPAC